MIERNDPTYRDLRSNEPRAMVAPHLRNGAMTLPAFSADFVGWNEKDAPMRGVIYLNGPLGSLAFLPTVEEMRAIAETMNEMTDLSEAQASELAAAALAKAGRGS
jgi:hypothetical protein